MNLGPIASAAAGWCAPAEIVYAEPPPPTTWLVDLPALMAMADADKAWLDEQWALTEARS